MLACRSRLQDSAGACIYSAPVRNLSALCALRPELPGMWTESCTTRGAAATATPPPAAGSARAQARGPTAPSTNPLWWVAAVAAAAANARCSDGVHYLAAWGLWTCLDRKEGLESGREFLNGIALEQGVLCCHRADSDQPGAGRRLHWQRACRACCADAIHSQAAEGGLGACIWAGQLSENPDYVGLG